MRRTSLIKRIELPLTSDDRGDLVFLEAQKHLPFAIKRLFYIFNTQPASPRGFHAHKKNRLALICLAGSVLVKLDDGSTVGQARLNRPNQALIIEPKIWHSLENFSKQAIILACNSEYYDENDYIRDYQYFKQYVTI